MKSKLDIFFSFSFYGAGLLALLIADIYVTQSFSKVEIAEWAFIKSLILIIGSICLLGYDQVFIRDTSLIQRFFRQFNFHSTAIILILILFLYFLKQYSIYKLCILAISIYIFAIISYLSASYRAKFNLWKAQFTTNLWRILLLVFVVSFSYNTIENYFFQSLFISLVVIFLLGAINMIRIKESSFLLDDKSAKKLGYSFVLTNITLILAVYGEQFLINLKENVDVSSHLFTYFSVFTPIALSLNGFIGFYYAPKVRKDNNMTISKYKSFFIKIVIYSLVIILISVIIGVVYMIYGLHITFSHLDYKLIISLSILCLIRGSYISTSVCLGVFGTPATLKKSAIGMCFSTLIYILLVCIILFIPNITYTYTALLISLASVINWILRFSISNYYTIYNLKKRDNNAFS